MYILVNERGVVDPNGKNVIPFHVTCAHCNLEEVLVDGWYIGVGDNIYLCPECAAEYLADKPTNAR